MAPQHIAHYTELTDALIKIMVVQIGADNSIWVKIDVYNEICHTLRKYPYETGGIIGTDEQGVITAFQFDNIQTPAIYQYYPNINFLNQIINDQWSKKNIKFAGFVHSHLHNCEISRQDTQYTREILTANPGLDSILIGIIDLSKKSNEIFWNIVGSEDIITPHTIIV